MDKSNLRIRGFDIEGDGLSSQGHDKDLHTTTEAEHQVKGGFLLDVVVGERTAVFQLLSSENQALLIRRDPLFILDLGFHVVDRIRGFDIESDGLSGQSLHKDLLRT